MIWALLLVLALALPGVTVAQAPAMPQPQVSAAVKSALARPDLAASGLTAEGRDRGRPRPLTLRLSLGQPVPYRTFMLADPPRLVVDFREVDFSGLDPAALPGADLVPALRWGRFRPGWSRLVMELPGPYALERATQSAADPAAPALLEMRLRPVSDTDFTPQPNAMSALWDLPQPATPIARPEASVAKPLRIALDPGHGGIDSGAQAGGISEAALVLSYARGLSESLTRAGFEVVMIRDEDIFIPLERRMTLARDAGADLFISLHADALPAGEAAGATIYSWAEGASDRAARQLAMLHDRADLLAGVDLGGTDDEIATVLMSLARTDTGPRSVNFAKFVASEMARADLRMHRRPVQSAAFSVLKAPDIPSVLIELGFLTDSQDRSNLTDPGWQARMVAAITRAASGWAQDDAARTPLLRR
ncbi:MAG: N-acetylmuramoyl-L-alanine amidase [Paracoccus sp. (in: a-proteobacteria)]|uniref:N-acetylmuramoyl-L-alanine amidase n=1 Tax=Paracoccus sp. TaxID=267 RepID=UPI0026E0E4D2|nr:N-acetylmuramoyl-L-alanine amidase [Paracoccus sp. (in: a-proteobacteria)]MDO5620495.1 N-acetylmuramoyl-L-alanine amidase [Paracoccus sp. (in: a-proteobacteria)]